ncbi:MAG: type IV toxin-antitoxin system AbiEi family antitoxin domain-containing protein [Ancrocorticia sp.]
MSVSGQLRRITSDQGGVLRVSEAEAAGINRRSVMHYVYREGLVRLGKGVYAPEDAWIDDMWLLSLRSDKVVFSHESALLLHSLIDREPEALTVTVPSGYNARFLRADGVRVYFIKPELLLLGQTHVATPDGNTVSAYDMERTICDLVRSRSRIDHQTFISALKTYARQSNKRLDVLQKYAMQLGVEKLLQSYLEVLL